jgi:hypothetical protein
MEKIKKPLFVTKEFIKNCFDIVSQQYPQMNYHIKILVECFIVEDDEDAEYFIKKPRWYIFGDFKKGELKLAGGISPDLYIKNAIEAYVNGTFKREPPKIIFPGDSRKDVVVVDNESYGIVILGCCLGNNQSIFLESIKDTIINSIQNLERRFPLEPKKVFFKNAQSWQAFVESCRISDFRELPEVLKKSFFEENRDILMAQIKTGLINNDFEFSGEEKNIVSKFIEEQEKF